MAEVHFVDDDGLTLYVGTTPCTFNISTDNDFEGLKDFLVNTKQIEKIYHDNCGNITLKKR